MEITTDNKRQFKAKFTGKCAICGGQILGWKAGSPTVSFDHAHYYQWRKRDASGKPVSGQIMHVDPSCAEVAAGEMLPSDMRDGAAVTVTVPTEITEILETTDPTPAVSSPVIKLGGKTLTVPKNNTVVIESTPAVKIAKPVISGTRKMMANAPWEDVLPELLKAGVKRIGLTGPAGTGKSTTTMKLAETVAKSVGRPYFRITLTERTTIEEIVGSFQLIKEDGCTIQKFVPGPLTIALKEGGFIQWDEFTHVSGEIESLMYAAWDDTPQLLLPDGDYIEKAAEGYCCIGTTNDAPEQMAPPLLDRCEAFLLATTPHPAALADCLPEEAAVCINMYRGLDNKPWKFSRNASVRMVRAFSRLRKSGLLSDELIAKVVFGEAGTEFLSALSTAALKHRTGR